MLLTLLPATALAANATYVNVGKVFLDGTPIMKYATTDANGTVTVQRAYTEADEWNIKFDNTTGTLTLRNAYVNYVKNGEDYFRAIDTPSGDLTITLIGENRVSMSGTKYNRAISVDASLIISGSDRDADELEVNVSD